MRRARPGGLYAFVPAKFTRSSLELGRLVTTADGVRAMLAAMNQTHVSVVNDDGRVPQLLRRDVPGFRIEPIDGCELMASRSLGRPVITNFAGTCADKVALYRLSNIVLSPSVAADRALMAAGVRARRICRWMHAVDRSEFSPAHYTTRAFDGAGVPDRINVLYVGPQQPSAEVESLTEAFMAAQRRDPRLNLIARTESEADPAVYASADLLLCPGASDLHGQVIVEAQASGLPVLAVQEGAAAELIESGRNGCLVPPGTFAFSEAIRWLARRATLRERLAVGGLHVAAERTWESSLSRLADSWQTSLSQDNGPAMRAA